MKGQLKNKAIFVKSYSEKINEVITEIDFSNLSVGWEYWWNKIMNTKALFS